MANVQAVYGRISEEEEARRKEVDEICFEISGVCAENFICFRASKDVSN